MRVVRAQASFAAFHRLLLGASKRPSDNDSNRDKLLVELATAVATRPYDEKRVMAACAAIKTELGEGPLMEAIGLVAGMEGATRCVDIAGKDPFPAAMIAIMGFILRFINWILSLFRA